MKVLLVLVDGMRPDSLEGIPQVEELKKSAAWSLRSRTVMPSVTLPCHMSMFHSVEPSRHGTTTNTYAPQVRPIDGLAEVLKAGGRSCALFYSWEPLRDIARPSSLELSYFYNGEVPSHPEDEANHVLTATAERYIAEKRPDLCFLYLGYSDVVGHAHGWMSPEYLTAVRKSWQCIEKISAGLPEDYSLIVTADHGGHDRIHGTEAPEDMTVPLFCRGAGFKPGEMAENPSILDIAPTVAALLGVAPGREWEGRSLL